MSGKKLVEGKDYVVEDGKVILSDLAKLSDDEKIEVEFDSEGEILAVIAVPTTGSGRNNIYRVGNPGRREGCGRAPKRLPPE